MPEFEEIRLLFKPVYSPEFIETLGRWQDREECEACEGSGIDLDNSFIMIAPFGIVAGPFAECECCNGQGWHYCWVLN